MKHLVMMLLMTTGCASLTPQEREDKKTCEWLTGQNTEPAYAQGSAPAVGALNVVAAIADARRKRRTMDACMAEKGRTESEWKPRPCKEECDELAQKGELKAGETADSCKKRICESHFEYKAPIDIHYPHSETYIRTRATA